MPSQGEDPTHFLEEKTKEKAPVEEMNKKYVTEKGSYIIIIRRISDASKIMATKIMACKFLRTFRKEKVPAEVVTDAT